jgi:CRISPR-associated protein Cmr1
MFLGGARQEADTLRPPPIKSALRWWWRALAWGQHFRDAGGDAGKALASLHRREAVLFGAQAREASGGKGRFELLVRKGNIHPIAEGDLSTRFERHPGLAYLLGPGLWMNRVMRGALSEGNFNLELVFRPSDDAGSRQDVTEVGQALWLWSSLGGLGARSRRGWGSVSLRTLEVSGVALDGIPAVPNSSQEMAEGLRGIVGSRVHVSPPPFSAFSAETRIDASIASASSAMDALRAVGLELRNYRNFRNRSGVFGADHDLLYDLIGDRTVDRAPRRAVFGLPNNAYLTFGGTRRGREGRKIEVIPDRGPAEHGRRASPLLIHIHEFPDRSACAVQTLMPADFLPDGERIRLTLAPPHPAARPRHECRERTESVQFEPEWPLIGNYMDNFRRPVRLYG